MAELESDFPRQALLDMRRGGTGLPARDLRTLDQAVVAYDAVSDRLTASTKMHDSLSDRFMAQSADHEALQDRYVLDTTTQKVEIGTLRAEIARLAHRERNDVAIRNDAWRFRLIAACTHLEGTLRVLGPGDTEGRVSFEFDPDDDPAHTLRDELDDCIRDAVAQFADGTPRGETL